MGAREFLVCGVTGVPEPLQLSPIGQIVPIALTHYCVMLLLTAGLSWSPATGWILKGYVYCYVITCSVSTI